MLTSSWTSGSSVLGDLPEKEVRISEVPHVYALKAAARYKVLERLTGGGRIANVSSSSSSEFGLAPRRLLLPSSGVDFSAQ